MVSYASPTPLRILWNLWPLSYLVNRPLCLKRLSPRELQVLTVNRFRTLVQWPFFLLPALLALIRKIVGQPISTWPRRIISSYGISPSVAKGVSRPASVMTSQSMCHLQQPSSLTSSSCQSRWSKQVSCSGVGISYKREDTTLIGVHEWSSH